ncbi:hypothetical protein LWI28_022536 [Acer negundo]|uniref:Uncharacterized protein n=1 Tax=Acer negundo TaxID=4023 RepID=A0AAD5J104_ACENE|nr:hypothetical protein LWI28_022536 [Acer negundo]KAK4848640.1 hypothetical protein QYF36_015487 [Acer negundo]
MVGRAIGIDDKSGRGSDSTSRKGEQFSKCSIRIKEVKATEKIVLLNWKQQLSSEQADSHFMDKSTLGNEAREEVTRESLIAISYSVPDKGLASKVSPEKLNGEKQIEVNDSDGAEKYRSELISISYSQSPDTKILPVTRGEFES